MALAEQQVNNNTNNSQVDKKACELEVAKLHPQKVEGVEDYYHGLRTEMKAFLPECQNRILEVGCAAGQFIECVENCQEYWGIEPIPEIAELARKKLNKVLLGTFDDVHDDLPDGYFDVVVCNDVIEHMTDHDDFLKKIQDKLSNGGSLVASVPNVRFIEHLSHMLIDKDWQYQNSGILDRTHLRFFTQKSLSASLNSSGFTVKKLHGINGIKKRVFPISRGLKNIMIMLLGSDTRYIQFGFRCEKS